MAKICRNQSEEDEPEMSAFATWFEAQHGPRQRRDEADEALEKMVRDGEAARAELIRRERWDERHTSALYAWQVKDQDK